MSTTNVATILTAPAYTTLQVHRSRHCSQPRQRIHKLANHIKDKAAHAKELAYSIRQLPTASKRSANQIELFRALVVKNGEIADVLERRSSEVAVASGRAELLDAIAEFEAATAVLHAAVAAVRPCSTECARCYGVVLYVGRLNGKE